MQREVIIKELVDLRVAHDLAKQRITDSGLRTGIMAESTVYCMNLEKRSGV